jgi:cellulose synthase/poly-beta-1,6-N-acetylglucosamine synthase-like glycosyltransferase
MSAVDVAQSVVAVLNSAVLGYFLLVNTIYGLLLVAAGWEMAVHARRIRSESRWRVLQSEIVPSISLLAPAYNEEATIAESVRSQLGLYYPNLEVVVVNDGSRDRTLEVLIAAFDLAPIHPIYRRTVDCAPVVGLYRSRLHTGLVVVDKQNGGKADALNAALNVAQGDLVCAIDADTLIEPDALQRMVRPFLVEDDVIAAGGTIRVANGCSIRGGRVSEVRAPRGALGGFQVIEYLRAFLFGRLGWNRLGGNLIISGAFGLFRRSAVLAAGGYAHDTVGEDMELVARLRRRSREAGGSGKVAFIPDPVAWTEAPESLRVLGRQRDRWHRGLADVLWRHRAVLGRPRYGVLGMVVFPYFVFVELLAPVVEAVALAGLVVGLAIGAVNTSFALLFFLVAYGLGLCLAAFTIALEELSFHRYERVSDRALLLVWALLENFGYRQLTVVWRLRGLARFLRGRKDWGTMARRGFPSDVELAATAARRLEP